MEPKRLYIAKSYSELKTSYTKEIDYEQQKSYENYIQTAARVFDAMNEAKKSRDDERTYCLAFRYCNIYSMLSKQFPAKKELMKNDMPYLERALILCEQMADTLKFRYKEQMLKESKKPEIVQETDRSEINNNNNAFKTNVKDSQASRQENQKVPAGQAEKETLTVSEFYQLVKSNNDAILLFDLREEKDFSESRIKVNNQINIPESFLKQKQVLTAKEVELCLEEYSLSQWNNRTDFDYIIMCDWVGLDSSFVYGSVFSILRDCLLKWSPEHPLHVCPLILSGGFRDVIDLFPNLTSNAKIEKPQYEQRKSLVARLDLSQLSVKEDKPTPVLPKPEIITVPTGVSRPVVDRSNKPKPKVILPSELPASSDVISEKPSYPDILSELAKPIAEAHTKNNLPDIAAQISQEPADKTGGDVQLYKTSVKKIPKVDRSLKPRLLVPKVKEENPLPEIAKLLAELQEEKEQNARLAEENTRMQQRLKEVESEKVDPALAGDGKMDIGVLREKKPLFPASDNSTFSSDTKPAEQSVDSAVNDAGKKDQASGNVENPLQETEKSSVTELSAVKDTRGTGGSDTSSSGSIEMKTYVKSLRDDGSSTLSNKSVAPGSALKRTNSSPNFEKSQINRKAERPQSPLTGQKPSPRRDRKPMNTLVLEIDGVHLKNFQPDYGNVSYGRCGLRNLGNTCYMNACLQCLSHTYLLREYIVRGKFFDYLNPNNKEGMGGYIVYEFTILLRALWNTQYRVISPVDIKAAMGKYRKQFKGTDQQDAQELLIALLDGLHEEVNMAGEKKIQTISDKEMDNKTDSELANIYWANYSLNNRSIIVDIFQGQYRSVVQCTVCSKKSTTFDAFMYLSLPIPRNSSRSTLYDCFQLYCMPEYIEWGCPSCKMLRKATKKLDVWRWPKYLIFHLKRFEFLNGHNRVKIQSKVDFPMQLMSDPSWKSKLSSVRENSNFSLYGVVNHSGGSMDRGHYVATVWIDQLRQWYKYDDSSVYSTSTSSVVSENAYLLFYQSSPS